MREIIVRLERYFGYPNIIQQTPGGKGIWGNIKFTEEKIDDCDYLVILDYPKEDIKVRVNPANIIHICLEPANEMSGYRQYANKFVMLVINQKFTNPYSIQSHGALPWHINKSYDYLSALSVKDLKKENKIAWITSNQRGTKGHINRMNFYDKIKNIVGIEVYGRGINPVADKWDVLSKYKYGIAYENFKNPFYWTEKIVDCYLSFNMPLYVGTENISNYFPKESYIQIQPEMINIKNYLKEILNSNIWEQNINAITQARNLVLEKYQLFPFLFNLINFLQSTKGCNVLVQRELIELPGGDKYFDNYPITSLINKGFHKTLKKMNKFF